MEDRKSRISTIGFIIVLLATVLLAAPMWAGSRGPGEKPDDSSTQPRHTSTIGGLQLNDLTVGDGDEARKGHKVTVHYTGSLVPSNEVFDSSIPRGKPFTFTLGEGQVIRGWDKGVAGMRVGGKRELIIPPHMAYGEQGVPGAIPPGSTLRFEVELLDVE